MSNPETVDLVCSTYAPSTSKDKQIIDVARPSVVLLHPFPFDARMWHSTALNLALHGWNVLVPNLRGCGASPAGDQKPSMELLATDVWKALDQAKVSKPILAGISLGGYVAMHMLRKRPGSVQALGLVDTKATADTDEGREQRMAVAAAMREGGDVASFVDGMLPRLIAGYRENPDSDVVRTVTRWMLEAHPLTIAWLQEAMAGRADSVATLKSFSGPSLLVRGTEDGVCTREDYQIMLAALPTARFVEICGAGHLPPVENSSEMAHILLEWLDSIY